MAVMEASSQNCLIAHDGNTFYRYNSRLVSCRYCGVILFRFMLILLCPGNPCMGYLLADGGLPLNGPGSVLVAISLYLLGILFSVAFTTFRRRRKKTDKRLDEDGNGSG